ncbi:MAG: CrcB family protein, partial [Actinobacteria bacterium]|nr:CrcB family protein [Actinomycetota bacterium]
MSRVLIVGIGGYFGAITRYLIGGWIANYGGTSFPLSTFVINITGSFFLGLVMALVTERFVSPTVQPLIAIGFIGAFT